MHPEYFNQNKNILPSSLVPLDLAPPAPVNLRFAPALAETDLANSRPEVARFNTLTREILDDQGFTDRDGIEIVVGNFDGRTTLEVFLEGLKRKKFIVPKTEWYLNGDTNPLDHDALFHFSRLTKLHPDMVDAVATFADKAIKLLATDRTQAEDYAQALDVFLSTVSRSYPGFGFAIATKHFQITLGVDVPLAKIMAEGLLKKQQAYEELAQKTADAALTSVVVGHYVKPVYADIEPTGIDDFYSPLMKTSKNNIKNDPYAKLYSTFIINNTEISKRIKPDKENLNTLVDKSTISLPQTVKN